MEVKTLRFDESTLDELEEEYEEHGFDSVSEMVRHLVENRGEILDGAPTDGMLADRVDALEAELEQVRSLMGLGVRPAQAPEIHDSEVLGGELSSQDDTSVEPVDEPTPRVASVDELDLPGTGDTLEARRDALEAVYERLQELGEAKKGELLEPVDPDAVGYQDRSSFWSNVIGGRDTLSRLPGVEPPVAGGRTWRYVGAADD